MQACLTLAVMATLPEDWGGLGGGVVYIDTESTFSPSRLVEIARCRCLCCIIYFWIEEERKRKRGKGTYSTYKRKREAEIHTHIQSTYIRTHRFIHTYVLVVLSLH